MSCCAPVADDAASSGSTVLALLKVFLILRWHLKEGVWRRSVVTPCLEFKIVAMQTNNVRVAELEAQVAEHLAAKQTELAESQQRAQVSFAQSPQQ